MKRYFIKAIIAASIVTTIVVCSVMSVFAETSVSVGAKFIPGDLNSDYVVNILDATIIQKSIAGMEVLSDKQMLAADFNGDNKILISDVTEIQKKAVERDYNCIVYPDNGYLNKLVVKVEDSSFANNIQIEKVVNEYDYFAGRVLNRNGIFLINSADEYFDLFGYCRSGFDKSYFEKNSLLVWTSYIPEMTDFADDFREITEACVSDGTLKLRCTAYEPFLVQFAEPRNKNYTVIYSVAKADIANINNEIQVYNELIHLTAPKA